jgi:hypothetical protein
MSVVLLVALGSAGQFGYPGGYFHGGFYGPYGRFGYPYGYYGAPLPFLDPVGYARYYNGSGYYTTPPTPVFPPKVVTVPKGLMDRPGVTGRVIGLDEQERLITLRLPAETVRVRYGPGTRWRSADDGFPEVRPGAIVNVDGSTVTVLREPGDQSR